MLFGMYGSVSEAISIDLANALLLLSYALTWSGARVFDGRQPLPITRRGAGRLAHLCRICRASAYAPAALPARVRHHHLPTPGSTAYEFWRGRSEPLVSRWPAIFMLFAHGSLFLLRTPLAAVLPWSPTNQVFDSVWLTVLSFEALLFTIAIAFILLAMAKERTEYRHKTAAMVDPLTGIANRRAFLQDGDDLMKRHTAMPVPGRGAADRPRSFQIDQRPFRPCRRRPRAAGVCEMPKENLRSTDLIGRLGGEEFAAVLYDAARDKAFALAERSAPVRRGCHRSRRPPCRATVSIGVVLCKTARSMCPDLLGQADQALYRAKARGQDRVEIASLDLVLETAGGRAKPSRRWRRASALAPLSSQFSLRSFPRKRETRAAFEL